MLSKPELFQVAVDVFQTKPHHQILGIGIGTESDHTFCDLPEGNTAIMEEPVLLYVLQPLRVSTAVSIGDVEKSEAVQRNDLIRVNFAGRSLPCELDRDDDLDRARQRHHSFGMEIRNYAVIPDNPQARLLRIFSDEIDDVGFIGLKEHVLVEEKSCDAGGGEHCDDNACDDDEFIQDDSVKSVNNLRT